MEVLQVINEYLQVLLRIPVAIINDARISCRQVDSKATSTSRQKKDTDVVCFVERIYVRLTILEGHGTVEAREAHILYLAKVVA